VVLGRTMGLLSVDVQSSVAYKVSAIESMLSVDAGVVMYSVISL